MKLFFIKGEVANTVFGPGKPFQPGLIFAIKHNLRLIRLASGKRYNLYWSDVVQWDKLVTWFNVFQTMITIQNIGKGFYSGGLERQDRDTIVRIWVIIKKEHEIDIPEISQMLTHLKEVKRTWHRKIVYVERDRFWTTRRLTNFIFFENYFLTILRYLLSLFSSDKEKSLVTMTYFYCVGTWQAFLA
jgi:hypothetical protein